MVFVAVSKNNEVHFSFMFLFLSLTLTLVTHYYIIFITVDTKFFVLKCSFIFYILGQILSHLALWNIFWLWVM